MILNPDGTLTCEHGNVVAPAEYEACGCSHTVGYGDIRELWNKNRMIGAAMAPSPVAAAIDRLGRTRLGGAVEHAPLSALLADRAATHGDFHNSSRTMQKFKRAARRSPNWERMDVSQREALDMILHKIGRVLHGDPRHKDHWDDIAGYATLVAQELG